MPQLCRVPSRVAPADRAAADSRRLGADRSRPHRRVRPLAARRFHRVGRDRSRRRRGPSGPRQRAHASRAVVDARPHSARPTTFRRWIRVGHRAEARRSTRARDEIGARHRRGGRRGARRGTAVVGDITNTLATSARARRARHGGRRVPRADRVQGGGRRAARRRGAASALQNAAGAAELCGTRWRRMRRTRSRRRCSARFGPRLRQRSVRAVQRAPRRVGGRDRVSAERHRTVARAARGAGRVGSVVGRAGAARSSISIGWAFSTSACSSCTACSSMPAELRGWSRGRDARHLSAQQRPHRRRRAADRRVLRVRACASRSAPTASPARPI